MGSTRPSAASESGGEARWLTRRAAASMRIEKAALELFLQRGVDEVTVDEIAAASGISRRTFYRYFETPDEILAAMPHRSLHRTTNDFQARPLEEHVLDAFIGALRAARFTDEERVLHELAQGVMRRSPHAWARAMGRMQPDTTQIYQAMIAERLSAQGRDPGPAGVIAAVFSAVLMQVCRERDHGRGSLSVDEFEAAMRSLLDALDGAAPRRTLRVITTD